MKSFAGALIALGLLSTAAGAQDDKKDKIVKLQTLAPVDSPWHVILQDMAEEWKKAMNGKLRFPIFAGSSDDEVVMVKKMRLGQTHAAALTGVGLSDIAPQFMALQLPMLLSSDEELDYVRDKLGPKFEAMLKKEHFILLNWGEAGWAHFFGQTPILSVDDVKKAKLFCWAGADGEFAAWKDIGANPVSLIPPEIHASLEAGRINALATTPLAALTFQWFRNAKEMSDMNWAPLIGATIITEAKWNEFPDDLKAKLLKSAAVAGERFRTETRKQSVVALKTMQDNKLTVHHAPPEVYPVWEKQARLAWPKLMGKSYPAELVAEIEKLRDECRAKAKEGKDK
ncbi:MAG: TRAP transporter substrate-binding protein DctP [Planctomycetes bacterium]|nr:TRAP transporter substrate-binding protein DctP [Planctomycetota bacterium]